MTSRGGSSPRMRGTVSMGLMAYSALRFIPAHAGNGRDLHIALDAGVGSSPRMRGTANERPHPLLCPRFIPAHAGNGAWFILHRLREAVHPRACGERHLLPLLYSILLGSSPRMRGTVRHGDVHQRRIRFIPAHAGNGSRSTNCSGSATVHPRACGERFVVSHHRVPYGGSSPRMRGTGARVVNLDAHRRFIPAHAGNGSLHRLT